MLFTEKKLRDGTENNPKSEKNGQKQQQKIEHKRIQLYNSPTYEIQFDKPKNLIYKLNTMEKTNKQINFNSQS
jgi:hypothetical protein